MEIERKDIRYAVKSILQHNTLVGEKVHPNRFTSIWEDEVNLICIYTLEEEAKRSKGSTFHRVKLMLVIDVMVKTTDNESIDDDVDYICKQVYNLLGERDELIDRDTEKNLSGWINYLGIKIGPRQEGSQLYVVGRMTYEVEYETEPEINENGVGDFKTASVDIETSSGNTTPEMQDSFEVQE